MEEVIMIPNLQDQDLSTQFKPYEFGDSIDRIALTESVKNAHVNTFR